MSAPIMLRILALVSTASALRCSVLGRPRYLTTRRADSSSNFDVQLSKPMGIKFEETSDGLLIRELIQGGSAEASGKLQEFDVLLAVDGVSTVGLPFDDAMDILKNAESSLTLTLSRVVQATKVGEPARPASTYISVEQKNKPVVTLTVNNDKLLRTVLLDNKIELYDFGGKLMNCGGGGQCGTCVVDVISDSNPPSLSPRTDAENTKLRKKSASCRLACQASLLGGSLKIRTQP